MTPATPFSQGLFTHGPSISLSLQSRIKMTVDAGSRTPASACTPSMIRPSGAPGISTTVPAAARKNA